MSEPGPRTFDVAHNQLLENGRRYRPGAVLALYQRNDILIHRAKIVLLEKINTYGRRDDSFDDALLITFIYGTEKSLGSPEYASERIASRKAAFKRRYGEDAWQASKNQVNAFAAANPLPGNQNMIDGGWYVAWFSQPHFEWLSIVTGLEVSDIRKAFQQDTSMVARAKLAVDDPPPEAFLPRALPESPTLYDSAVPKQLLDDYLGAEALQKAIVKQVQEQMFVNGPPSDPVRPPRVGKPKQVGFEAGIGSRPEFEKLVADEFEPAESIVKFRSGVKKHTARESSPSLPQRRGVGPRSEPRRISPTATEAQWASGPINVSPRRQRSKATKKRNRGSL